MPPQMKAGVVCWKNQRETAALSLKGHTEWVLVLEVIINFALSLRISFSEDPWCAECRLSAVLESFQLIPAALGIVPPCTTLHNIEGLGSTNRFEPFRLHLSEVVSELLLLTPVPAHTYSGKGAKGQGQLMAMSVPHKGWCEPSPLLPIPSLVFRSRASLQLCA